MNKAYLLLIFLTLLSCQAQQRLISGQVETTVIAPYQYYLSFPSDYSKEGKPSGLLLFLHGGGESGRNLEDVKKHGPPKMMAEGYDFPFMVLAPQNPHEKKFWDVHSLMILLEEIRSKYNIDQHRIYLTGLSRGGSAAWEMAVQYPETFAALTVVCGRAPVTYAHWLPKNLPIWVFHGSADPIISVTESDAMVEKLEELGHEVKYTRYEGVGHNSWEKAYQTQGLFEWMAKQELKN